ncbi:MAG: alkaline phosphatase family protein [Bryobacteraceae bacterium]
MAVSRRNFPKFAAGAAAALLHGSAEALPASPKLLIFLILEQFRTDYLTTLEPHLTGGGFRRLMEGGAFYPDCRMLASTFDAPAIATLATGAYPEVHGIVADRWYDAAGSRIAQAAGPQLLAGTLAETLRRPRGFVFASSEPEAGLIAGRSGVPVVATDGRGQVVGRQNPPEWLEEFNRQHPVENVRDAAWMALGAGPGAPPLRTLSYNASRPRDFYALYNASPFAQSFQLGFVRDWVARERMGQGSTTDVLMAALAPMARLGYETGADSPLMEQMVLQLDLEIDLTLEFLGKTVGAGNFTFVAAGAHGAPPAPAERRSMAVAGESVARAVEAGLASRFDARGTYVARYVYPFLYLKPEVRRFDLREVRLAAGQAAMKLPQVAGFYTADGLCSFSGEWERRFRNSFHAERSGDVMLAYRPGYVEDFGAGRGVSYGSLYNYDARVPLLLYGPQFRARTFESRVETIDIAPTLARALGVTPPSSSTGRVLGEAFAEGAGRKR